MEDSIFFSITIPSWNRAYILPETISCIQKQTFNNWEVIVVDDGSTDNTEEVVRGFDDPRISYVFQENAERSAARNNGAGHAKGKYLLFLDSDDKYAEDHLEKLHAFIRSKSNPVALFFTGMCFLTEKGLEKPEIPLMKENDAFNYLLFQPITPSRVAIHRDIFNVFRFDPKIVIVEDMVLWVSISTKFPVFQLPEATLYYRIHGGNSVDLSSNSYLSRYKGLLRFFQDSDYAAISAKIPGSVKSHLLAECCFNMARHFEFIADYSKMKKELLRSFHHKSSYRNKERLFMYLNHSSLGKAVLSLLGKGKAS